MSKTKRIKVAFTAGIIVGVVASSMVGYGIGSGKLQLPKKQESCYAVECNCNFNSAWHCGIHYHECDYYRCN